MSQRGVLILVGGSLALAGLLAIVLLVLGLSSLPAGPRPPELAGQRVPATVYEIRFDRQYDLFCSFFGQEPTIFRNCTILGFTGHEEDSRRSGGGSGFVVFSGSSGSGSASSYAWYFDHWLVLKLSDGRLAYIPPRAVYYIEEASPKDQSR